MDSNIDAQNISENLQVVDKNLILKILPKRHLNSNKGTYGHVLNIAGSALYPGAAHLCSLASLRVGAGYSMLATTTDVVTITASKTSDITYFDLGQSKTGTIPKDAIKPLNMLENVDAVTIGCGLSTDGEICNLVIDYLKKNKNSYTPFVIDADALNICAYRGYFDFPMNSILTPHPMELSRLLDVDVETIQSDRIKWALDASNDFDSIVVLKGYRTIIATPRGKVYINDTGNSALSKAGTGDILTGMIAGFLASGAKPEEAAILGCYIHGAAGEIAARALSEYSVLASDVLKYIPIAFKMILK